VAETETKLDVKAEMPRGSARWSPMHSLREEIDRLFDDFDPFGWRMPGGAALVPSAVRSALPVMPPMNLSERSDAYELALELPGLEPKDVEVRLANGTLTIRGEKSEESEDREGGRIHRERRFGSFQRSMRLPDGVDVDAIQAAAKGGVLRITLPKSEVARAEERSIEVRAA
jgi:HSP20 family protein